MKVGFFVVFLVFLGTFALSAEDAPEDAPPPTDVRWAFELDPDDPAYPDYLADPRRMRLAFSAAYFDSEIPETSSGRAMLDAGTRFTLFRVRPAPQSESEFSVDILGGVFMQFDLGNQLDNIGWDGIYGLNLVYSPEERLAFRLGYRHLSAHIGDEYIERTGRERISYTRDDLTLGVSYQFADNWTAFVEPRWGFNLGDADGMEEGAVEAGFQYESPKRFGKGNASLYAGVHMQAHQESDWKPGVSVQGGVHIQRGETGANMRIGLEAYTGRAILGEYALDFDESYLLCGFLLDFY